MKNQICSSLTMGLLLCLFISCQKDSIVAPDKYEFEGEWSWVETTSGWGFPLNPENLGHSLSLSIDHSTYTMFVDDQPSTPLKYEFKTDTNHFGTIVEYINLEDGKRFNVEVDSVNLVLSENVLDGGSWYYVRK